MMKGMALFLVHRDKSRQKGDRDGTNALFFFPPSLCCVLVAELVLVR